MGGHERVNSGRLCRAHGYCDWTAGQRAVVANYPSDQTIAARSDGDCPSGVIDPVERPPIVDDQTLAPRELQRSVRDRKTWSRRWPHASARCIADFIWRDASVVARIVRLNVVRAAIHDCDRDLERSCRGRDRLIYRKGDLERGVHVRREMAGGQCDTQDRNELDRSWHGRPGVGIWQTLDFQHASLEAGVHCPCVSTGRHE
jgi:hypothetical protein